MAIGRASRLGCWCIISPKKIPRTRYTVGRGGSYRGGVTRTGTYYGIRWYLRLIKARFSLTSVFRICETSLRRTDSRAIRSCAEKFMSRGLRASSVHPGSEAIGRAGGIILCSDKTVRPRQRCVNITLC